MSERLPDDARRAAESIGQACIVIGIPSYNNGRTIGHVVRAANAGLAKYFPHLTGVVINSDGGSTDNTREAVLSARVEDRHLMLLSTPMGVESSMRCPSSTRAERTASRVVSVEPPSELMMTPCRGGEHFAGTGFAAPTTSHMVPPLV